MRRLAIALLALLLAVPAQAASSTARDFAQKWTEAGKDEAKKKEALDWLLNADKSEEAAKLFLWVAANDDEEANVVELALRHMAALESCPGDQYLYQTLQTGKKWTERALIVRAFTYRDSDAVLKPLAAALSDKQWQVEAGAIAAIARHRVKDAVEALIVGFERLGEPKDDSARRLAGDYRDALTQLCDQKLSTAQDWRNWWGANAATVKLDKSAPEKTKKDEQGVTAERAPKLFDEVLSRRVVFILDTSGSMQIPTGALKTKEKPNGITRFEAMKLEAKRVVDELPAGAKFNIVTFADAVLPWAPKLEVANDGKKKSAEKFIENLKPEGQTNSFGALEAAFRDKEVDTIYFLSDGFPTGGKITDYTKICNEVAKWNATRNIRIHTIAFLAGDGKPLKIIEGNKSMPKAFMSTLAEQNSGHYKCVE